MTEKWLTKECAELLSNMMTCAEVKEAIKSAVLFEREACAKVCEEVAKHFIENNKEQEQVWLLAGTSTCAAAIRARGK